MLVHQFVAAGDNFCFCPGTLGSGRGLGLGGRGREGGRGGGVLSEERTKEGSVGARVSSQESVPLLFGFGEDTV